MTVDNIITELLGTSDFSEFEQKTYAHYQEQAEQKIITHLNALLSNVFFCQY